MLSEKFKALKLEIEETRESERSIEEEYILNTLVRLDQNLKEWKYIAKKRPPILTITGGLIDYCPGCGRKF